MSPLFFVFEGTKYLATTSTSNAPTRSLAAPGEGGGEVGERGRREQKTSLGDSFGKRNARMIFTPQLRCVHCPRRHPKWRLQWKGYLFTVTPASISALFSDL